MPCAGSHECCEELICFDGQCEFSFAGGGGGSLLTLSSESEIARGDQL
jgi:hypothetical protein